MQNKTMRSKSYTMFLCMLVLGAAFLLPSAINAQQTCSGSMKTRTKSGSGFCFGWSQYVVPNVAMEKWYKRYIETADGDYSGAGGDPCDFWYGTYSEIYEEILDVDTGIGETIVFDGYGESFQSIPTQQPNECVIFAHGEGWFFGPGWSDWDFVIGTNGWHAAENSAAAFNSTTQSSWHYSPNKWVGLGTSEDGVTEWVGTLSEEVKWSIPEGYAVQNMGNFPAEWGSGGSAYRGNRVTPGTADKLTVTLRDMEWEYDVFVIPGDQYELHKISTTSMKYWSHDIDDNLIEISTNSISVTTNIAWGSNIVSQLSGTVPAPDYEWPYTDVSEKISIKLINLSQGTSCAPCNQGPAPNSNIPGGGSFSANSTGGKILSLSLGKAGERAKAGSINLDLGAPSSNQSTPGILRLSTQDGLVSSSVDGSGNLERVEAPETLVEVSEDSASKFTATLYSVDAGVYQTNEPPIVEWVVEAPGASTNNYDLLTIVEVRGASSITNLLEWSAADQVWAVTEGNGLKKEVTTVSWNANMDEKTELVTILDPGTSNVVSQVQRVYGITLGGGEQLIEEIQGPNSENPTWTQNSYTTNGLLSERIESSGYWERLEYNSDERVTKRLSGYKNQAPTSDGSLCRVTEYSYTALAGSGDDGSQYWQPRTTINKVLGQEISRSYSIYKTNETWSIQAAEPEDSWDDNDNQVRITKRHASGEFKGTTLSSSFGSYANQIYRLTTYTNSHDGNTNLVKLVASGVPNGGGDAVVKGTYSYTTNSPAGRMLGSAVIDIETGLILEEKIYSNFDDVGRAGRIDYLDGTFETFDYSCCNLDSHVARDGITTVYTYDELKRKTASTIVHSDDTSTTRGAILDSDGNAISTYLTGTNAVQMIMSTNTFDGLGRRLTLTSYPESEDITPPVTQYSYSTNSTTVILPDGHTKISQMFMDGQAESMTGTAAHGVRYDYGVEQDGGIYREYRKVIKLLENGTDSLEWTKDYTDALGLSYKTVYPDGAFSTREYNAYGQLIKSVDPDGVTTLFQYNDRGEQEYSAVDMDQDGVIDFDGTDRITRQVTSIVAGNATGVDLGLSSTVAVKKSESYVWDQDNVDSGLLTTTSYAATDSLATYRKSISFGLTNLSITVSTPSTVTVTSTNISPNGSWSKSVRGDGRNLSSWRYDSNDVKIGGSTPIYDPMGRVIESVIWQGTSTTRRRR